MWITREVPPGSGHLRAVQVTDPLRHPKAAPSFDCAECGRYIGKQRSHVLLRQPRHVICARCFLRNHDSGECESMGTRAGMAHALGLWP